MSEKYPQKCIKCHSEDVELEEFPIVKTRSIFTFSFYRHEYRTMQTNVPVCTSCKSKFTKFQHLKSRADIIGGFFSLSIFTMIILFFVQFFFIEYLYNFFLFFLILSVILIFPSIILYAQVSSHPDKISNYVSFKKDTVIIKNPDYRKAIVEHAITKQIEDKLKKEFDIDIVHCPKCGSKQKKNADFCLNCGKELRKKYKV